MKRLITYLLPAVFFLGLLVPLVNDVGQFWSFDPTTENRNFAKKPVLKLDHLDAFPDAYEAFFKDWFSFRTPLLDWYHHYKFRFAKVSAHPDKTIIGEGGWYFISGAEHDTYLGKNDFSEKELDQFVAEWQSRDEVFRRLGVKQLLWIIIPTKHSVYPEFLKKKDKTLTNHRRTQAVIDYLKPSFPNRIVDPLPNMLSAKDSIKIYQKLDNHWNDVGGFVAADLLVETVRKQFPSVPKLNADAFMWKDTVYPNAFHRNALGISELTETNQFATTFQELAVPVDIQRFSPPDWFMERSEFELNFAKTDTSGPRILVIRDSFGRSLIPFLKEQFGQSTFIFDAWKFGLNEDIVRTIKPDIVVYATLESNVGSIISKN